MLKIFANVLLMSLQAFSSTTQMEFSILTYNVAGLPEPISASKPAEYTKLISPKLNDYDVVLVQEDFFYHRDLESLTTHPHASDPDCDLYAIGGGLSLDMNPHCLVSLGDGLNRFSRLPYTDFQRIPWDDCYGYFENASDCLTPKGFSVAKHEVAPQKFIHIYNLHADAGGDNEDKETRRRNYEQLADFIKDYSKNAAVIVAGDVNSKYKNETSLVDVLLTPLGLSDAAVATRSTDDETVDKILYRSSNDISITPTMQRLLKEEFTTDDGKQLSDHEPRFARFQVVIESD